jgi:general stress protein YciG
MSAYYLHADRAKEESRQGRQGAKAPRRKKNREEGRKGGLVVAHYAPFLQSSL